MMPNIAASPTTRMFSERKHRSHHHRGLEPFQDRCRDPLALPGFAPWCCRCLQLLVDCAVQGALCETVLQKSERAVCILERSATTWLGVPCLQILCHLVDLSWKGCLVGERKPSEVSLGHPVSRPEGGCSATRTQWNRAWCTDDQTFTHGCLRPSQESVQSAKPFLAEVFLCVASRSRAFEELLLPSALEANRTIEGREHELIHRLLCRLRFLGFRLSVFVEPYCGRRVVILIESSVRPICGLLDPWSQLQEIVFVPWGYCPVCHQGSVQEQDVGW